MVNMATRKGLSLDEYVEMLHNGQDPHRRLIELANEREKDVGPWNEAGCTHNCWMALEAKCVCRCSGLHHGEGIVKTVE